jgi:23S rRNA (uracil1939-C5)-methyltransferase
MAHHAPFEAEIGALGPKGIGRGTAPDGKPVLVARAPPGSRVLVAPQGRKRGIWSARRLAIVRPAPEWEVAPCPQFGTCGGCSLQELGLAAQRRAKQAMVLEEVGSTDGIRVHPLRGTPAAYGYRNKLELSFGPRRWLPEDRRHEPIEGRFLGFHAPGRFDRVVDAPTCDLAGPASTRAIAAARAVALADDSPPPFDPKDHTGFWRTLLLRESRAGEVLAAVYTTPGDGAAVERMALALREDPAVMGVLWVENAGVADVARGEVLRSWGTPFLEERLGDYRFRLSHTAFFQTNTAAAEILYQAIAEAAGSASVLLDLYCGIGSIGIALSPAFERVIGIEEVAAAVDDARENALRNGVAGEYHAGRVEDLLGVLDGASGAAVVVDPPRSGLHPAVARRIAGLEAEVLVYVACNPASLGRDREILQLGGWRPTDLWTVDLFPQTGHVEAVMRFDRGAGG